MKSILLRSVARAWLAGMLFAVPAAAYDLGGIVVPDESMAREGDVVYSARDYLDDKWREVADRPMKLNSTGMEKLGKIAAQMCQQPPSTALSPEALPWRIRTGPSQRTTRITATRNMKPCSWGRSSSGCGNSANHSKKGDWRD
ncbi:MAG: hypothetical protein HY922_17430 [Elusimicrobia bacterium]|nr:hypothetical protein [Elusimicrobiota bacterium]